jgi:hypothetical protein
VSIYGYSGKHLELTVPDLAGGGGHIVDQELSELVDGPPGQSIGSCNPRTACMSP